MPVSDNPVSSHTDCLIAGGGMVGLSMALALAREGLRITVVERAPYTLHLAPEFDGRVSAIALGSQRLLAHIGAWEGMAPYAEPIMDIRVSDGDSLTFLHYDHREVGTDPFGWIVENRHIRQALVDAVQEHKNIRVIAPAAVTGLRTCGEQAEVTLSDGSAITASLVIGADGKQSGLRALAGIRAFEASYKQTAIVCTIEHAKPHLGLAQERFLTAGPFAVLPMQANRSSLVWTEPHDRADMYLGLPEEAFVEEIRERVGDYLGTIRTVGPRFSYPLSLLHAYHYTAPRVALIGDAAHAIHPIAGQGVNLGFRDVAVLAELVGKRARLGLDIGAESVLAHYARWRRFDNVAMLFVTDALNRLFSTALPPVRAARRFGLWAVGKVPPLKRQFMRHAMGLSGDLPELMQPVSPHEIRKAA